MGSMMLHTALDLWGIRDVSFFKQPSTAALGAHFIALTKITHGDAAFLAAFGERTSTHIQDPAVLLRQLMPILLCRYVTEAFASPA